eukprot:gene5062-26935_t
MLMPTLAVIAAVAAAAPDKANVIFILSDDLGYGDYSLATEMLPNATRIPTPNVERMAKTGIKFHRGYSGQVCAPSRCTLMTGMHLGHCTIRGNDGAYSPLLPTDQTIATVLKKAGKWGLGNFGTTGYPLQQGFDWFVGQDTQVGCHNWYPTSVCNNTVHEAPLNTPAELNFKSCLGPEQSCTWMNDLDRNEAVKFINHVTTVEKMPFFLYLATTTPHSGFLQGGSGPKPPGYVNDYPVPYNTKFSNESGVQWNDDQKAFAAAVWAQDVMVGAVLDALESLSIREKTVVFFSGDNGPDDHPFGLFDDPGIFRGKKRSLHEGGIRQTIVVSWPGTITAGATSDQIFTFWDLLPTAADIAGLPKSEWPNVDGISALPLFQNSTVPAPDRYLYYEFCKAGSVDGLLPQSYCRAGGWVQAVRWDDNATQHRTEWKGFVCNSNTSAFLLYNITADQNESYPIIGNPEGPDDRAMASPPSAEAARAMQIILSQMDEAHTPNKWWPKSTTDAKGCCNSCFTPKGCAAPCWNNFAPPTPPGPTPPPPPPGPPVPISDLSGTYKGSNGKEIYTLNVDAASLKATITNPADASSSSSPSCVRQVYGTVSVKSEQMVVDVDYPYYVNTITIVWKVCIINPDEDIAGGDDGAGCKKGSWPTWTRTLQPQIQYETPPLHEEL